MSGHFEALHLFACDPLVDKLRFLWPSIRDPLTGGLMSLKKFR